MITITRTRVYGFEAAIRGMRNPLNSWDRADSFFDGDGTLKGLGKKDFELMMKLAKGGPVHAKYRRYINLTCDIKAPMYWWKEMDTYKVGVVAPEIEMNSCSTMHKLLSKNLSIEDFSIDDDEYVEEVVNNYISNFNAKLNSMTDENKDEIFKEAIRAMPMCYIQKRTVQLNYEALAGIYNSRQNHKLSEWKQFCDYIKGLPYSNIITLEDLGMTPKEIEEGNVSEGLL